MQRRIALRYALFAFIIGVIWTLIEHYLGYNTTNHAVGQYTRMLTAFIFYFFIILAIWEVRRKQNNQLNFSHGLKTSALVSVSYAVLIAGWLALYAEVINPNYQSSLLEFERKKMIAAKLSDQQMTNKLKEIEFTSGGSFASYVMLFVFMALFGIVVAFMTTFVLKRKKA